jgi:hypothetical protein
LPASSMALQYVPSSGGFVCAPAIPAIITAHTRAAAAEQPVGMSIVRDMVVNLSLYVSSMRF